MKIKVLILSLISSFSLMQVAYAAPTAAEAAAAKQCAYNGENYGVAVQFEQKVQKVLAANDIHAFAKLFTYPITVNQSVSKHEQVRSVKDMIIRYPTIMTETMKQYILADQASEIFCNDQGVMIGQGSIWFHAGKKSAYPFVINVISHS
ncbi:MAG: hypothetical protein NTV32_01185 [Gammaproteobacteria bacterium]|nr:hypothetical protein [Gammaproteobacteria bacterium]